MAFHLHTIVNRVTSPETGALMPFAGKRSTIRSRMAQAWMLRACDPTRRSPLAPRHDLKREVDSKAEVSGT
jgi:hypothetical protein